MKVEVNKFTEKQTAAQTWCLLRSLPLLLGRLVPLGNDTWKLLLQIADAVEVVTAPMVNKALCVFLANLMETFSTTYFNLYPNENMKPKLHYLIHYPQQMLEFRPLIHCWTLRFEGKHVYSKELSNRTKKQEKYL
ncbi:hypothetical protein HOLleu_10206 [Holothuria leucospilota]|uniref:Uncharacterized protein n=1 Tax=Holothuria leucospilota TaxID=206669 RepID=A0A9Q1HEP3_HOLLE|nr:hypothetical protein HOLleu_10206 [Holothuria leucospilota]